MRSKLLIADWNRTARLRTLNSTMDYVSDEYKFWCFWGEQPLALLILPNSICQKPSFVKAPTCFS